MGGQGRWKIVRIEVLKYGVALLSVALALGFNLLSRPYLDSTLTPLFFAAVMVSSWYGGLGSGLLATALSTLAINYFLVEPISSLSTPNLVNLARLSVFVMAAILINSLNEAQRIAQRRAEANLQSLRESEARFGCLVESNIIGIIEADLNGPILEANDIFLQMVGYTQEELHSGRVHWREMTPPESLEVSERAVQELKTTGACTPFEKEYIRKDGSRVSVLHGAAMTGETTVIGFVLDLSDRKRSEGAQQEAARRERELYYKVQTAKEQLETVLASINDQFLVLDREWRYIYINDRVKEVVGISREDMLGKCIWELFPETVDTQFYVEVHHAAAEQRIIHFEYFYSPWQRWFENHVYPSATGVSILVTEITARKRAEETLQRTNQTLQTLIDVCPVAIAFFDPQGIVRLWNRAAESTFGWSAEETIGQFMPTVPHRPQEFLASIQMVLSGQSLIGFEAKHQRKDGRMVDLEIWANLTYDAEGNPGCLGITLDITQRKRAEAEREQLLAREQAAREQAEAANRIKDEFLAVLSHELRSPLNPILGWTKLLQTGKLDAQASQRALDTIERNAKLQTQLIEDLLDVSRILRGKMALTICPINLVTIIESAKETVRLAAEAKHIQIQTVVTLDNGQVSGDSARLQQIVWNLLSNAIKFTPDGGKVEIRLDQIGTYAQIQVRDTGIGISPDFLPYVFDYFRQEDGKTTRKFGGLGLGLAIVRHLTELHGGTVHAESFGEGLGATFTVRLPLMAFAEASESEIPTAAQSVDLSQLRILVVDDDEDMRDLVQVILEQQGAQVTLAASAAEALMLFERQPPDIVISDIGMPDMDGYMLMEQIRKRSPEQGGLIRAIALTAYAGEYDQRQALKVGFQKHIPKPVEPEALVNAISELTG
ncbi:PAS domain S-box protein [Scytonema sp. UIC 10036]|nr:PAS domain S-box protein [Scytonema sp. UIC 10036]